MISDSTNLQFCDACTVCYKGDRREGTQEQNDTHSVNENDCISPPILSAPKFGEESVKCNFFVFYNFLGPRAFVSPCGKSLAVSK